MVNLAGSNNPRGANTGRYERTLESAERDAHACRLRAQGRSFQQIANELGIHSKSAARSMVQRALVATVQEAGDELRVLELERLNLLLDTAWRVMETVHYAHSQGRVVKLDDVPLVDSAPVLAAMDRILKIMERRAKLVGLDAPVRHTVMTVDMLDAEIADLEQKLAARAADDAGTAPAGEAPTAP